MQPIVVLSEPLAVSESGVGADSNLPQIARVGGEALFREPTVWSNVVESGVRQSRTAGAL